MMYPQQKNTSLLRKLAISLLDTDERRYQTVELLDTWLPELAADVENLLFDQQAKIFHEIYSEHFQPKIRVIIRLEKMEHEYAVLLDSKHSMFVVGTEVGGLHAGSATQAAGILKSILLKFKVS